MTKEEVFAKLKAIMQENFELEEDKIQLTSNIVTDLDLDSIDAIDMVSEISREVNCRLSAEDFKSVRTVGDIVDVIHSKLEK